MPPSENGDIKMKSHTLRVIDLYNKIAQFIIFITTYTHRHQGNHHSRGVVEHHCRHHCLVVVLEEEDHLDRLQWVHPHLVVVVGEEEEVLLKYDSYIYYKSKTTLRSLQFIY